MVPVVAGSVPLSRRERLFPSSLWLWMWGTDQWSTNFQDPLQKRAVAFQGFDRIYRRGPCGHAGISITLNSPLVHVSSPPADVSPRVGGRHQGGGCSSASQQPPARCCKSRAIAPMMPLTIEGAAVRSCDHLQGGRGLPRPDRLVVSPGLLLHRGGTGAANPTDAHRPAPRLHRVRGQPAEEVASDPPPAQYIAREGSRIFYPVFPSARDRPGRMSHLGTGRENSPVTSHRRDKREKVSFLHFSW